MLKDKKGFTLVELIIVIIIVAILVMVSVPVYKGYVSKAVQTEGKAVLERIGTFERLYYVEFDRYYTCETTSLDRRVNVDVRTNKFFTSYYINADDFSYSAVALHGEEGKRSLTLRGSLSEPNTFLPRPNNDAE